MPGQLPDDPALEPFRAMARDPNGPNILEPSRWKKFWQANIENPDDWKKFWKLERSMPWLDGKQLSDIVSGRRRVEEFSRTSGANPVPIR